MPPDPTQLQVLVGTLLGRGRLVAADDGVHLVLVLAPRHAWLAQWTYERLAPFVPRPVGAYERVVIRSEPHPLFAELAARLAAPHRLRAVVGPEAIWLWALHQRVAECERRRTRECTCALLRRPRPRALAPAS